MKGFSFSPEQCIIGGLPMPPSTNHLYSQVTRGGKTRRFPSKEYQQYKKAMEEWTFVNQEVIRKTKNWLRYTAWNHNLHIAKIYQLDRYYLFRNSQIWTKEGKPKKLDVTNRIKAFDDLFCATIGIDDSQIWTGNPEKITIPEYYEPCVIVKIRPVRARNWESLKNVLHLNQDT